LKGMILPPVLIEIPQLLAQRARRYSHDRIDVGIEARFFAPQSFDGNRVLPYLVRLAVKILVADE
jgi:hypothetical protein